MIEQQLRVLDGLRDDPKVWPICESLNFVGGYGVDDSIKVTIEGLLRDLLEPELFARVQAIFWLCADESSTDNAMTAFWGPEEDEDDS